MSGDLIWAVVRMLVTLPLVLGAAFLVIKYGLGRRYVTTPGKRLMRLVEQLPLGPKTTLSLIAMGGRYYLLAHQDSGIQLVKELDELPEAQDMKTGDIMELTPRTIEEFDSFRQSEGPTEVKRFPDILGKLFGRRHDG